MTDMPKKTPPVPKSPTELNEFQAAARVSMSPELLRWFASYAPKQGDDRKLEIRNDGATFLVEEGELIAFDDWLRMPWPSKGGKRPPVPTGIHDEIKAEAGGECAACHNHANSCEAAHIEAVHASKNNHPENLIWLCANHHTKFDNGSLGPKNVAVEFVRGLKTIVTHYRRSIWKRQGDVSGEVDSLLTACAALKDQLKLAKTSEQIEVVENLTKDVLSAVHELTPSKTLGEEHDAFLAIQPELEKLAKKATKGPALEATLQFAEEVQTEYRRRAGYVTCRLCDGTHIHNGEDCPACGGEGELTTAAFERTDFTRYDEVDCPLCKAEGVFRGEACPVCFGDRQMERRFAEVVDPADWTQVTCPLCEGSGALRGNDCPVCHCEGTVDVRDLQRIELRDYELVPCPKCKGSGSTEFGVPCRICNEDGEIERRYCADLDPEDFKLVECPICEGRRYRGEVECRACGGEGKVERERLRDIDERDYEEVLCPTCRGGDDFCRTCGGDGRVERWFADRM